MGSYQSRERPMSSKHDYYYDGKARDLHYGDAYSVVQKPPSEPRDHHAWMLSQAQARLAAQPRTGPHSQLSQPIVSSLDPHKYVQNPLDSHQDNVMYTLSTFRNRNSNHDPRGQPELHSGWQQDTDQHVQIRNVERLDQHGRSHQIEGCTPASTPVY